MCELLENELQPSLGLANLTNGKELWELQSKNIAKDRSLGYWSLTFLSSQTSEQPPENQIAA